MRKEGIVQKKNDIFYKMFCDSYINIKFICKYVFVFLDQM
jgi:hypothetical protein